MGYKGGFVDKRRILKLTPLRQHLLGVSRTSTAINHNSISCTMSTSTLESVDCPRGPANYNGESKTVDCNKNMENGKVTNNITLENSNMSEIQKRSSTRKLSVFRHLVACTICCACPSELGDRSQQNTDRPPAQVHLHDSDSRDD